MEKTPNIFLKIEIDKRPAISIRKDGKPYFNKQAVSLIGINDNTAFKIAKGKKEKCIFLFPVTKDNDTLNVSKLGQSFYINNVSMFRKLGFIRKCVYQITTATYKGETIFKISL